MPTFGFVGGPPLRAIVAALAVMVTLGLLSGCASYKLGMPVETPFKTLHVATVETEALVPQAAALLTRDLREAFIRDGRLTLVNETDAGAILAVTLVLYERDLSATASQDTARARSFDLELTALATLTGPNGQTYFKDRRFIVEELAFTDAGLLQSEYGAMPVLTRDLANKIRDAVLGAW